MNDRESFTRRCLFAKAAIVGIALSASADAAVQHSFEHLSGGVVDFRATLTLPDFQATAATFLIDQFRVDVNTPPATSALFMPDLS